MKKIKTSMLCVLILSTLTSCSFMSKMDAQKLNLKANKLMKSGDYQGAISRLESINDLNPGFSQTYYNLGVAYHKTENYEKAAIALKEAVKIKHDFADAYYTLGVVYEDWADKLAGNNNESEQSEKTELKPELKPEIKQAVADNLTKSIEFYTKYLSVKPDAPDKNDIEGKIKFLQNDLSKYTDTTGKN